MNKNKKMIIEDYPQMIYGTHLRTGFFVCKCPECGKTYKCSYFYDYDNKQYSHSVKYCPNCGTKN